MIKYNTNENKQIIITMNSENKQDVSYLCRELGNKISIFPPSFFPEKLLKAFKKVKTKYWKVNN